MWTVNVKAVQSELNESELPTESRTHEGTNERPTDRTHHQVTFLHLYNIDVQCRPDSVIRVGETQVEHLNGHNKYAYITRTGNEL